MSAGSGASNLGYGNIFPFSNVNPMVANVYSMNNPANFTSKVISGTPPGPLSGLAGTKDNVAAAEGKWPGPNIFKGGAKGLRKKIKNISIKYKKMKGGSKKKNSLKKFLNNLNNVNKSNLNPVNTNISRSISRAVSIAGGRRKRRVTRRRRQRGGYAQYQNNMPLTPSYSTGGILKPTDSALANPVPYKVIGGNCVDNYNHFTNKGFPSRGH
jgi:hypothetical protein